MFTPEITIMPHWHAYAYTGQGYRDGEIRKGVAPPSYPPLVTRDYLQRKALFLVPEGDVEKAVSWLETELRKHVPLGADLWPIESRLEYSRRRLLEKVNRDVVYGYWSVQRHYVSRSLIFCEEVSCR